MMRNGQCPNGHVMIRGACQDPVAAGGIPVPGGIGAGNSTLAYIYCVSNDSSNYWADCTPQGGGAFSCPKCNGTAYFFE